MKILVLSHHVPVTARIATWRLGACGVLWRRPTMQRQETPRRLWLPRPRCVPKSGPGSDRGLGESARLDLSTHHALRLLVARRAPHARALTRDPLMVFLLVLLWSSSGRRAQPAPTRNHPNGVSGPPLLDARSRTSSHPRRLLGRRRPTHLTPSGSRDSPLIPLPIQLYLRLFSRRGQGSSRAALCPQPARPELSRPLSSTVRLPSSGKGMERRAHRTTHSFSSTYAPPLVIRAPSRLSP